MADATNTSTAANATTTKKDYEPYVGNENGEYGPGQKGNPTQGSVKAKYIIGKIPGYNSGILPVIEAGSNSGSMYSTKQDLYYNRLLNNLNTIDFTPTSYHLHFTGDIANIVAGIFSDVKDQSITATSEALNGTVEKALNLASQTYEELNDSGSLIKGAQVLYQTTKDLSTNLFGDTIRVSRMKNSKQWVELLYLGILHSNKKTAGLIEVLKFGFTVLGTNDSTFNETISNSFGTNRFQEVAGDIGAKIKSSPIGMVGTAVAYWKSMNSNAGIAALKEQGQFGLLGALSGLVQGVKIELPQVWQNADYTSSLNIMIKLISPSGDSESIRRYIKDPLEILLRATAPVTVDGLTYGYPMLWDVRAHGIMHLKLAAITAMTITRGGNDTVYNKYDEPLNVDVRLMITPINQGFAQGSMRDYSMTDPTDVIYSLSSAVSQRDVEWVGGQYIQSPSELNAKKIMI